MVKKVVTTLDVDRITGLSLPVNPTDAVNKAYVDSIVTTIVYFPFWDTNGQKQCIETDGNSLPFWLSDGTRQDISLGC